MTALKISVDGGAPTFPLNDVKVMVIDDDGVERHYTITHEGVILDTVCDGDVVATRPYEHGDLDGEIHDDDAERARR